MPSVATAASVRDPGDRRRMMRGVLTEVVDVRDILVTFWRISERRCCVPFWLNARDSVFDAIRGVLERLNGHFSKREVRDSDAEEFDNERASGFRVR